MKHGQAVRTLNELITISRDGERGFGNCAQWVRDWSLRRLFAAREGSCALAALELSALVRQLGGEPVRHGSTIGAVHRGWVDLRAALAYRDDVAILAECERGEGYALEVYRNALDDPLPDFARTVVLRQFLGVMENHDEIGRLIRMRRAHPVGHAPHSAGGATT